VGQGETIGKYSGIKTSKNLLKVGKEALTILLKEHSKQTG
jgi:hypothetical protein